MQQSQRWVCGFHKPHYIVLILNEMMKHNLQVESKKFSPEVTEPTPQSGGDHPSGKKNWVKEVQVHFP